MVATEDQTSNAQAVLARLKNIEHEPDDELWMLLDTDHCIKAELDKKIKKQKIPSATTSRVYLLWHAIASKALKNQLPVELHGLLEAAHAKLGQ